MNKNRKISKDSQVNLHKITSYKNHIWLFCIGLSLVIAGMAVGPKAIEAKIAAFNSKKNDEESIGVNALMSAVVSHDVEGVRFFVKAGDSLINQKNLGGATPLHLACRQKDFEIAQILVENKADVNAIDNENWTPLMRAALAGQGNIVNLLLDNGANAALINSVNESAIYHATLSGCNECLMSLFDKYNFIKLMNIDNLKSQLSDSYVIAQNHENHEAQELLSKYLDQVKQMENLIVEQSDETSGTPKEKVFKFVSSKTGKTTIFKSKQSKSDGGNAKAKKYNVKAPVQDAIKEQRKAVDSIEDNSVAPEAAVSSEDSSSRKFKFVQGEKGKIIKKKKIAVQPKPVVQQVAPVPAKATSSVTSPMAAQPAAVAPIAPISPAAPSVSGINNAVIPAKADVGSKSVMLPPLAPAAQGK